MAQGFRPAATGYFGKLPARGDFVTAGLPEAFIAPWDGWCREMLAASREQLGEGWFAAWMEGPIWHFLIPPGACGPQAARGVVLPSADKVGRHFPFALCALADDVAALEAGGNWAAMAEQAGVNCVIADHPHEALMAILATPAAATPAQAPGWWTAGSPYVKPVRVEIAGLPVLTSAGALLRDPVAITQADLMTEP
jgi:type VI secretion system protein ImpM